MKTGSIIFVLMMCLTICVSAQNLDLKGVVKEAKTKAAIEFVNIVLQTEDSVFVTGSVSDANGKFTISGVKQGNYILNVSAVGYERQSLNLKELNASRTLPDIMLEEASIALGNITVSASNESNKIDRKLVYPSERQMKASSNGLDLLQQLMLPKLIIDPIQNEVKLPGGGEPQYRINGVKVEITEVIALQPADIIRIEYHDNPGIRYGNAEIVLNYIVRRPETGGSLGLNLNDGITAGWGNNFINGRINHKKSEFSTNYRLNHREFYNVWRNNEEQFTLADGSILHRREAGAPSHWNQYTHNINAAYSFLNEHRVINISTRAFIRNQPYSNYRGVLYNTANPADMVNMEDNSANKSIRPALDIYYQESLKNDQTIVLNMVGTYNSTTDSRMYREQRDNIILTDIENAVTGSKLSFIGEGIYENKLTADHRISAGIKHTQSQTNNEYTNGHNYTTEMTQSETVLYGELKGRLKNFDYTAATGFTRWYYFQKGIDSKYDRTTYGIKVTLQYTLPDRSTIRLMSSNGNSMPALSELSAVDQTIDSLQIRRGNPYLKPYNRFRSELTYSTKKGLLNADLWGTYEYLPKAIMDEKFIENGKIIQTWNNQKNWQRLATRLSLRFGPVNDILQIATEAGFNHYISNGNTYRHTYTNYFGTVDINATYKAFSAHAGIYTNWNWFYGETMEGGENTHELGLKYKHKALSVGLSIINPFIDNYKVESENRSQYASYKRSYYINETSRCIVAHLTWNTSFGRSFNSAQKRVNNADEASGVINSGK